MLFFSFFFWTKYQHFGYTVRHVIAYILAAMEAGNFPLRDVKLNRGYEVLTITLISDLNTDHCQVTEDLCFHLGSVEGGVSLMLKGNLRS